jgi:hypothetical protein
MKFKTVNGRCIQRLALDESVQGVEVRHLVDAKGLEPMKQAFHVSVPVEGTFEVEITVKKLRTELPDGYRWEGDRIVSVVVGDRPIDYPHGSWWVEFYNNLFAGVRHSSGESVPLWVIEAFQKEGLL